MTISPFDARLQVCDQLIARILVRDFNHQLEKVVSCKVLQFIHDEDQEDAWSQNPTVHKHNNFLPTYSTLYQPTVEPLSEYLIRLVL